MDIFAPIFKRFLALSAPPTDPPLRNEPKNRSEIDFCREMTVMACRISGGISLVGMTPLTRELNSSTISCAPCSNGKQASFSIGVNGTFVSGQHMKVARPHRIIFADVQRDILKEGHPMQSNVPMHD